MKGARIPDGTIAVAKGFFKHNDVETTKVAKRLGISVGVAQRIRDGAYWHVTPVVIPRAKAAQYTKGKYPGKVVEA
jgi:hypothetical protein